MGWANFLLRESVVLEIAYNFLVLSPYAYSIFACIIVQIVWAYKNIKLNLINYLKSCIYLCPSLLLSVLSICIVPYREYDLLPPILFSFALPVLYSLVHLFLLYFFGDRK